jgi:hypothetical protein
MIDLPVWDYGSNQRRNVNNPEFREHGRQITIALTHFLQDHDLLRHQMLKKGEEPGENFRIMESDLNERGVRFFRDLAIDRFLGANDDIRKPLSIRSLERSLKKLKLDREQ